MQMHQLDARVQRLVGELKELTVRREVPVESIDIAAHGSDARSPFANGSFWPDDGEWWDFFCTVRVPGDFAGRVVLKARTGRESEWEAVNPQCLIRVNGRIEQAYDTKHTATLLQPQAVRGETFAIELNGYSPLPTPGRLPPVLDLRLQDIDGQLEQLVYDIEVPYLASLLLPEGNRERETTLETLAQALDLLDLRAPYSLAFDDSIRQARAFLAENYYAQRAGLPPVAVAECVGHTHIDVAWLWDLEQTRHKAVRSFATVLKLMEQYPEYRFMSSQAALYAMVKEDEPALYARIQEAVRQGRWEVEGGMWVEADCNLASGESLVRQFLYGQAFFQREFGKRSRILWLPDVFGYSAALPQIMRQCGIQYFMTTKLSWSEFNLSPYDTFRWKGIDGTEILTHFTPARDYEEEDKTGHDGLPYFTTYNAMLTPRQISGGWQRFQQKGLDDHFLVCYGFGDGGGGPTEWMLENARRMAMPMPATPVVRQAHARDFFDALAQRVQDSPLLPKWSGELYLEYHRGTYTAMARNKRSNRKIELALRDAELWSALAEMHTGLPYPAEALYAIWQDVLTLQFHDILPGSSIQKVYDDSAKTYAQREAEVSALAEAAQGALAARVDADLLAFNSLASVRDDIVWFDAPEGTGALRDSRGTLYPVQFVQGKACAFVRGLQPTGITPLWFAQDVPDEPSLHMDADGFDTPYYTARFDSAMRIESLLDKRSQREVARESAPLNRIVCYENKPHNYDAWDINIYYDRRHWDVDDVLSVQVISVGPVLARLRVVYQYMQSSLAQDITVYRDLPRIDFDTTVVWREAQYMLKAHFPVDVFYNEATYDIQYGNLKRPTHKNTSWDIARFEVCAHKWADVSEDGFGVSVLNDCKYGYSIDEHSMALTLLKSSTHPNPIADRETHRFTYSLLPHSGAWREGGTIGAAYALNIPVAVRGGSSGGVNAPITFASVSAPNIIVESVKKAEDGDGFILRLYECHGRRTAADISLGFTPTQAEICNMLEEKEGEARIEANRIPCMLRPYEIRSYRIR